MHVHYRKDGVRTEHGRWIYSESGPRPGDIICPFNGIRGPIPWMVLSVELPDEDEPQIAIINYVEIPLPPVPPPPMVWTKHKSDWVEVWTHPKLSDAVTVTKGYGINTRISYRGDHTFRSLKEAKEAALASIGITNEFID